MLPILLVVLSMPPADAGWSRSTADPRTVTGIVQVKLEPGEVWRAVSVLENWPRLFTDVRRLKVKGRRGDVIAAEIDTRIFDCGPHEYRVRIDDAARSMTMDIAALGLSASGSFVIEPGGGGTSTVRYSLTVEVKAPASWFASEADVRKKQERMVAAYLADIASWSATEPLKQGLRSR